MKMESGEMSKKMMVFVVVLSLCIFLAIGFGVDAYNARFGKDKQFLTNFCEEIGYFFSQLEPPRPPWESILRHLE